jgi:hypothetical protein
VHVDVVLVLVALVLVPVALLVLARRRHPGGQTGAPSSPDKTVLHCAAPAPPRPARGP